MMTLRWQPWQEMEAVSRQLDRMFDDLMPIRELSTSRGKIAWAPAIELHSSDTEYTLRAQLPGIEAKDLDVQVSRNGVTLSGEHKVEETTEKSGYLRSEFRYGSFQRVVPLPSAVQNDQVKAEFKHGVLTLVLPRVTVTPPSVVKVNLGESASEEILSSAEQSDTPAPEVTIAEPAPAEPVATSEDVWQN